MDKELAMQALVQILENHIESDTIGHISAGHVPLCEDGTHRDRRIKKLVAQLAWQVQQ